MQRGRCFFGAGVLGPRRSELVHLGAAKDAGEMDGGEEEAAGAGLGQAEQSGDGRGGEAVDDHRDDDDEEGVGDEVWGRSAE